MESITHEQLGEFFDRLVGDINKFRVKQNSLYDQIELARSMNNKTEELMEGFVKTTIKGKSLIIHRDNNGDKIVINSDGMKKVPFRHKRGIKMKYLEVFNTICELREDKKFLKILHEYPETKVRIDCFIKAIMKIPDVRKAVNDWNTFQKETEIIVFEKPIKLRNVIKSANTEKETKLMAMRIDENQIALFKNAIASADECANEHLSLDDDDLDNLYKLFQLMPIIEKRIDIMSNKVDDMVRVVKEKTTGLKDDLSPILTLEALDMEKDND